MQWQFNIAESKQQQTFLPAYINDNIHCDKLYVHMQLSTHVVASPQNNNATAQMPPAC